MASSSIISLLGLAVCLALVQCQDNFDRDFDRDFNRDFDREDPRRDQTVPECREKVMDIYFVLDASSSIWVNDVERERQFVRDVVNRLDVGNSATRVGILAFSDDVKTPTLGLNSIQIKSDVLASVTERNLPHITGITNTHLAIRYVREDIQFREDITKVIVVITDGGSTAQGATAREAELARENGFYLFVVGVGQYLDENEWRSIASDPDDSFIYNITNFRFLSNVRNSLAPRACALPPILIGRCRVDQQAEVFVAAGTSGANSALQLLDTFVDRTTDDDNFLRMNLYLDACNNAFGLPLDDVEFACDRFKEPSEDAPSLRDQLGQIRTAARNSRDRGDNRAQVAVLFVDEDTMRSSRFDFSSEARSLERDGVELIVVDLGVRTYVSSLQSLATSRDNYVRFLAGSLAGQQRVQRQMLDTTCNAINRFFINGPGPQ